MLLLHNSVNRKSNPISKSSSKINATVLKKGSSVVLIKVRLPVFTITYSVHVNISQTHHNTKFISMAVWQ